MFTQKVRTITSPSTMNCQRWSPTERSRPATTLAANRVRVTRTTLAATTWPIRESPRLSHLEGLHHEWGPHPISAGSPLYDNVR